MDTITIIGSILAFRKDGISEKELENIYYFLSEHFNICISKSIREIYYEIESINDNFYLIGSRLKFDPYYLGEDFLKRKYFNPLSYKDKSIIYGLLAMVK